jgi:predicted lipoprotein with Yx(FWY)xxD motif
MKRSMLALVPGVAAIAAAGCGTTSGTHYANNSSTSAAIAGPATSAVSSTLAVRSTKLGKILVDSHGRTLYLFEKDKGTSSTCLGACATVWPPVTVTGAPRAGDGLVANKLGTTRRADGKTEVTYNGHPLYYYVADTAPGQTLGQGLNQFGAGWDVLSQIGDKIEGGS